MEEKVDKQVYDRVVKERDDARVKIEALRDALEAERETSDALRVELVIFKKERRMKQVADAFERLKSSVEAAEAAAKMRGDPDNPADADI